MTTYSYLGVRQWWKSRSLWFARALMLAGAVVELVNASSGTLLPYFGKYGPLVVIGIGMVNEILRWATRLPIGRVLPPEKSELL